MLTLPEGAKLVVPPAYLLFRIFLPRTSTTVSYLLLYSFYLPFICFLYSFFTISLALAWHSAACASVNMGLKHSVADLKDLFEPLPITGLSGIS